MQERRDARKEGCRKAGLQERMDAGKDGCRKGGIKEVMDSNLSDMVLNKKDDNFNERGIVFFSRHYCFVLIHLLNVLFREIRNIRICFSHKKLVSQNTKFRETRELFLLNTKLSSHEILENLLRKKLKCQP